MKEDKFCVNCKHCRKWATGYHCFSPSNGRSLVTGDLIVRLCLENRKDIGLCKEEGLLFESKEGCSYA